MVDKKPDDDKNNDGAFIIRGKTDPILWEKVKALAAGSEDDRLNAVELIINRIRELPEDADKVILDLSKNSTLAVKRKLADLLSTEPEIPWGLWLELIQNLDKEDDQEIQKKIAPLMKPYHDLEKSLSEAIPKGFFEEAARAAKLASQLPLENIRQSLEIASRLSAPIEEIRKSMSVMGNLDIQSFSIPPAILDSINLETNSLRRVQSNFARLSPSYYPVEKQTPKPPNLNHLLISKLRQLQPGLATWVEYQKLSQDILTFCFVPPLMEPFIEEPSTNGIHRRDMIYQIPHDTSGFWEHIRNAYGALVVIADAKNYSGVLPKDQIVIQSKYYGLKKLGNFGLIITRNNLDESGKKEQEDRWLVHNELVICLSDEDIIEMIRLKLAGQEPEKVINRKIFELRKGL